MKLHHLAALAFIGVANLTPAQAQPRRRTRLNPILWWAGRARPSALLLYT
jgi:hypothetical protein